MSEYRKWCKKIVTILLMEMMLLTISSVVNGLIVTPNNCLFSATRTKTITPLWFAPTLLRQSIIPYYLHTEDVSAARTRSYRQKVKDTHFLFRMSGGRSNRNKRQKKKKKKPQSNTLQNADGGDGGIPEMAQIYPEKYDELLAQKVDRLSSLLRKAIVEHSENIMASSSYVQKEQLLLPIPQIFDSPQKRGFRMRATFHIWRATAATKEKEEENNNSHDKEENKRAIISKEENDVSYVMFEPGTKNPYKVTEYPMGSERLQELMDPVRTGLSHHKVLSIKLKDVRFHTTLFNGKLQDATSANTDAIIVLNYYDQASLLDERWKKAAQELQRTISSSGGGAVTIIGKSRKSQQNVVVGETIKLYEQLVVPTGIDDDGIPVSTNYSYYQTEGAFSQPNAMVCQNMLGWAYNVTTSVSSMTEDDNHDLCELYCGNGCFTVVLASNFRHVLATELSHASVQLAQQNLNINFVTNARVVQMTAEEFVNVWEEQQNDENCKLTGRADSIAKLQDAGITDLVGSTGRRNRQENVTTDGENKQPNSNALKLDQIRTLFVDPPRAGLDKGVRQMASKYFDRIIYMSCNPETLKRDLVDLLLTHQVTNLAAFDQFPYTPHLEVGIVLERRQ